MQFNSRKLNIWLISFGAIFVVYLLYNAISDTPTIKVDTPPETVVDSNKVSSGEDIGRVGDVGIEQSENVVCVHRDEEKQIDRKWGFKKLLHKEGEQWELDKPFFDIYGVAFDCYMTGDRGSIQVESVLDDPVAKDAKLTGNVIIRLLPKGSSKVGESLVYLDDVVFISERSLFTSDGPIRVVNDNFKMVGRGFELIYNEGKNRLEYFKMIDLESLKVKTSSQKGLFSSQKSQEYKSVDMSRDGESNVSTEFSEKEAEQRHRKSYRLVLRDNVVIDNNEQVIFADEVCVNNILLSKSSKSKPSVDSIIDSNSIDETNIPAKNNDEPNGPVGSEEFVDFVVTCDGGIVAMPMEEPVIHDLGKSRQKAKEIDDETIKKFVDANDRTLLTAKRIDCDYSGPGGDVVAKGPLEIKFWANNIMDANKELPVTITAGKAEFSPALNTVIFEDNVVCEMVDSEPNVQDKYELSGQNVTVKLSKDTKEKDSIAAKVKHVSASGSVVELNTSSWAGEERLGFTKLKCKKFDLDPDEQLLAYNGLIAVDNSKAPALDSEEDKFSLQKPCYTLLRYFGVLEYSFKNNEIIAEADPNGDQPLLIQYLPVVEGGKGRKTEATAGSIKAQLIETGDDKYELSKLYAADGVTYNEEGKKNIWGNRKDIYFEGGEMLFDAGTALITVRGNDSQPCFLNGGPVDGIEYNLKTGRRKVKIVGPGSW